MASSKKTGIRTTLCLLLLINANAFLQPHFPKTRASQSVKQSFPLQMTSIRESETTESIDVVLYGVGDLRTDDHGGLTAALQNAATKGSSVFPVMILDTQDTLPQFPGAIDNTVDTAAMLSKALDSLKENLEEIGLSLLVQIGRKGVCDALEELLDQFPSSTQVRIHICDLGDVDNSLGYGPWSHCRDGIAKSNVRMRPWRCQLRSDPWENTPSIPSTYTDYKEIYASDALQPLPKPERTLEGTAKNESKRPITSSEDIFSLLRESLKLDTNKCKLEESTGLYGTHWGGLDPESVGETQVLKSITSFVDECNEDDELWVDHPDFSGKTCRRNPASLEHAAVAWMMKGDGSKSSPITNNMIAGEAMTRFLAAPLMLGTVSPRRLWHSATKNSILHTSVLRTIPESREWHNILAARNLRIEPQFTDGSDIQYGYWRWNGFLCRYARSTLKQGGGDSKEKEGILLVHGFGASSSQWSKTLDELSQSISREESAECAVEGLAPCLIGFGQSEKPPLTYTAYLWDSYVSSFVKEIAVGRHGWNEFVVGGNSIGGFTAMSCGADDTVKATASSYISGSGAPGTGRCTGVVLMNSAGQIRTRDMLEKDGQARENGDVMSVGESTASDALPACKPLPRPAARLFGNGLLAYLRPRIQSICTNLYPTNPDAVDDALCDGILRDSLDPGAINVMISGSKLPPPRTANELLGADYGSAETNGGTVREGVWKGPVLVAQGVLDPLNDAKGRASMFRDLRDGITVSPINAGHCPHDELPQDVALSITSWLKLTKSERANSRSTSEAMSTP